MKLIYTVLLVVVLLVSACAPIQPETAPVPDGPAAGEEAAFTPSDLLPVDADVRIGQLDNGLTYYIRHNDEPMNRADLWLAVNAGSLQEDEDQLGLAHFLEHMLFNGTKNFPGMGLVNFLESIGMEFGPDVNARTSFDETVYTIQVPTDDAETLDTAFLVLEDWAGYATLDAEEVDKERGVIVEEWRLRQQTASGRISEQTLPFILGDSRDTDRRPIGDMDIVRTAPAETLRRYYEEWYRPDLMSVIAVGDFDVEVVEDLIQQHFSDLPSPAEPPSRLDYDLPEHEDTRYLVVGDPEETTARLQFIHKRPAGPIQTLADAREDMTTDLFYNMLNERLNEIAREADAPFLSASSGAGTLVRAAHGDFISTQLREEDILGGLDAIVTEVERARRHGFNAGELERAKEKLFSTYERRFNERNNTASDSYANQYLNHFLKDESIASIGFVFDLVQELLPEITLEEVNEKAAGLVAVDNRVVYITAPEKEGVTLPVETDLAAVVDDVMARELEPYVDEFVATDLLEEIPAPAAIVSEETDPELGVTTLQLENGVRVLMKSTDFKDDEIVFRAVSSGGSSLVTDEDFPEASTIDDVVNQSGVGPFTQNELIKLLAGKTVSTVPYIRELTEGMEGSVTPADLETLFQLIYLYFTAPRADESAFEVFRNQQRAALGNREQDPNAALQDGLYNGLYGDTIRRGPLTVEDIDSLDLARSFEIYQDRFGDAGDFSFSFVGSFDDDELKTLAQTYLGNLPTSGREEQWQDVAPDFPTDVVVRDVYKGEGDRSVVQLVFTGPVEPSRAMELELNALAGVLDILLREELREELGGVYSSGAYAFVQDLPDPTYFAVVSFGADPDRVDELVDATFAQIEDLQQNGPSAENVQIVQAQQRSTNEEQLEQNSFWANALKDFSFYGDADKLTVLDGEAYGALVDELSADQIQQAAQKYLRSDRYVKATLFPEANAPEEKDEG